MKKTKQSFKTISKNYIYHGTVYGKNNTGGTAA